MDRWEVGSLVVMGFGNGSLLNCHLAQSSLTETDEAELVHKSVYSQLKLCGICSLENMFNHLCKCFGPAFSSVIATVRTSFAPDALPS